LSAHSGLRTENRLLPPAPPRESADPFRNTASSRIRPLPEEIPELDITPDSDQGAGPGGKPLPRLAERNLVQPSAPELALPPVAPIPEREPINNPSQLKKVAAILPFADYEPDPDIAKTDPCYNLCPRPDGAPCAPCKKGDLNQFLENDVGGQATCPACPDEIRIAQGNFTRRVFPWSDYQWEASNLWYYPLYFEDVPLERYGHSRPFLIQPFFSAAKFAVQAVGLPYQATIDPIRKCKYPLGYYRIGDCVPYKYYQIPWNTEAALVEAGFVVGGYYLFSPGTTP
jgi:hypothetical protein